MFDLAQRQKIAAVRNYRVEPAVAPGFAAFLVAVCLVMSVLLFGAGNLPGGLIFGSILIPVYLLGPEWLPGKPPEDESGRH